MVSMGWKRFEKIYPHVPSQQLDLERHNGLAYPDHGKDAGEDEVLLGAARSPREEQTQQQAEDEGPPQVPVPQTLAHASLENDICIGPSPCYIPEATPEDAALTALCCSDATSTLHHATEQVLGVEDLLHLLPDGEDVARQRLPYRLVDGVCGGTAVLAGDARGQVRLRACTAALDVSCQRGAVRGPLQRIVQVIEGSC